ncbi:hypothetical protein RRG08_044255 [Elysia crispata]|uniref:Uncharacterized protein n=1 Tax=Elysia crispata TaxID=231223 RepID=A0AAE0XXA4_9GAST|nr:hypothetical protein RRG08_044255 [Elysia crispata]
MWTNQSEAVPTRSDNFKFCRKSSPWPILEVTISRTLTADGNRWGTTGQHQTRASGHHHGRLTPEVVSRAATVISPCWPLGGAQPGVTTPDGILSSALMAAIDSQSYFDRKTKCFQLLS